MPTHNTALWRSTYLLGVALLLPIGTIVLVTYYFARMNPFAPEVKSDPWAFAIIAMAGGLSALMATLLALFASATYRARVRFEAEYRQLQRYLNEDVARDRTRLIRNLDLVSAAQQVSMAIKQETEFERILSVVLEQLEHFARSDSITVFTIDEQGKPAARAERRHGVDRFPRHSPRTASNARWWTKRCASGAMCANSMKPPASSCWPSTSEPRKARAAWYASPATSPTSPTSAKRCPPTSRRWVSWCAWSAWA
ncbi:MAG: hypothetical protein M5U25_18350 [Planctomycetota bacterium]|nr:hypothetical protein [Planctomycetota bacterium]